MAIMVQKASDVNVDRAIAKKDGSAVSSKQFPPLKQKGATSMAKSKGMAPTKQSRDGKAPAPTMMGKGDGMRIFAGPSDSMKGSPHVTVATSTKPLKTSLR